MKSWSSICLGGALTLMGLQVPTLRAATPVAVWLTDPGGTARFERQAAPREFGPAAAVTGTGLEVSERRHFQEMVGFGFTLTGGSAQLIRAMGDAARESLLTELFAAGGTNIGVSYLRISVGASDLNPRVFTYDDLAPGETDPDLLRFDLGPDRTDVIPVLRQILSVNPRVGIMASPWTAPSWMKTNGDSKGGHLKRDCYGVYARYLVKYVEALRAEGISVDALTIQNEPLNPDNNPSMEMTAAEQAEFIRDHLGPAFRTAALKTKIVCYDHNADRPDYPLTVLADPGARSFVEGSAFHLYAGSIDALSRVHEAYPDRSLYFTEQWIGAPGSLVGDLGWHLTEVVVGASRNWCRTVLEWNLAADPKNGPHTDRGGCDRCLGALTLDGDRVVRNPAYYIIAHASKFVRPGSVRIESSVVEGLPNVAFRTPEGRTVLVVLNRDRVPRTLVVRAEAGGLPLTLPAGAAATCVW
ncbi:MAG: hypothetical protein JNL10_21920 [Verrucomicrobiales bacterium]|nr:hypothetical protein [Verrucomicrobiales bacterium]